MQKQNKGQKKPYFLCSQHPGRELSAPDKIIENLDYIESLPFDGLIINVPDVSGHPMGQGTKSLSGAAPLDSAIMMGKPLSCDFLYDRVKVLKGAFKKFEHNFAFIFNDRPADFFDDWSITIENWKNFARAVKKAGLRGIVFDNEPYRQSVWQYPKDCTYKEKSLEEYQTQVRLRGREVMEAVVKEFPDIVIMVFHGPYISVPNRPALECYYPDDGWAKLHLLEGAFFVGMMEGMGSKSMLIDGGELYSLRTKENFKISYEWRKHTIATNKSECLFIPEYLKPQWPQKVSISFGVYNHDKVEPAMNPAVMRTTLENAMRQCDDYAWVYTEGDTWLEPNGISNEWIDSVQEAIKAVKGKPYISISPL